MDNGSLLRAPEIGKLSLAEEQEPIVPKKLNAVVVS